MALVKMYRDEPEVVGGNTEAMIPEEAVNLAMDNGWKKADDKKNVTKEIEKPAEPVKEQKVETKPEVKTEFKPEAKGKGKNLRDE